MLYVIVIVIIVNLYKIPTTMSYKNRYFIFIALFLIVCSLNISYAKKKGMGGMGGMGGGGRKY